MRRLALALFAALGCGKAERASAPAASERHEVLFDGMCDASGAVGLSDRLFVVADDEDNVLRVYDAVAGGGPVASSDLSLALGVPFKGKKRPRAREVDLEAGARIGERAYWLTSHGRNKKAKLAPERLQLFATTTPADGEAIALAGQPYDRLLDDLIAEPSLASFGLRAAAELAPKEPGGFNLEGLTARPDGGALLGFRNPIPGGRALLVPLDNLDGMIGGGETARFGPPVQLDLGGRGVRGILWWRDRYLVIGGAAGEGGGSAQYRWAGGAAPARQIAIDVSGYNPEGFFGPADRDEVLLVSDDGSRLVDGVPCKELDDPAKKQFRGLWLRLP